MQIALAINTPLRLSQLPSQSDSHSHSHERNIGAISSTVYISLQYYSIPGWEQSTVFKNKNDRGGVFHLPVCTCDAVTVVERGGACSHNLMLGLTFHNVSSDEQKHTY
eukprot:5004684-Pyramimonas_sp.AAC.1